MSQKGDSREGLSGSSMMLAEKDSSFVQTCSFCAKLRIFVKKIISVISEFTLHFWTEPGLL